METAAAPSLPRPPALEVPAFGGEQVEAEMHEQQIHAAAAETAGVRWAVVGSACTSLHTSTLMCPSCLTAGTPQHFPSQPPRLTWEVVGCISGGRLGISPAPGGPPLPRLLRRLATLRLLCTLCTISTLRRLPRHRRRRLGLCSRGRRGGHSHKHLAGAGAPGAAHLQDAGREGGGDQQRLAPARCLLARVLAEADHLLSELHREAREMQCSDIYTCVLDLCSAPAG